MKLPGMMLYCRRDANVRNLEGKMLRWTVLKFSVFFFLP